MYVGIKFWHPSLQKHFFWMYVWQPVLTNIDNIDTQTGINWANTNTVFRSETNKYCSPRPGWPPCFSTSKAMFSHNHEKAWKNQKGQFTIQYILPIFLQICILKTNMICGIFMTKERIVEMNIARVFKRKYLSNRLIRRKKNPPTHTKGQRGGALESQLCHL